MGERSFRTPSETKEFPAVSADEVEDLTLAIDHMESLLDEADKERRRSLGSRFAHQAAREAVHIQERIYRLLPAAGVIPSELVLPMGILPDEVAALDHPTPAQFYRVTSHLPDRLLPHAGELTSDITPEPRILPQELAPQLATAYSKYNFILQESGLGEAMRTTSVARWIETFIP